MSKTIMLAHKELGVVAVDEAQFNGNPEDGHGWSKAETEARGFAVATKAQIDAEKKAAAERAAKAPVVAEPAK